MVKGKQMQLPEPTVTSLFRVLFNSLNFVDLDYSAAPQNCSVTEGGRQQTAFGSAGMNVQGQ